MYTFSWSNGWFLRVPPTAPWLKSWNTASAPLCSDTSHGFEARPSLVQLSRCVFGFYTGVNVAETERCSTEPKYTLVHGSTLECNCRCTEWPAVPPPPPVYVRPAVEPEMWEDREGVTPGNHSDFLPSHSPGHISTDRQRKRHSHLNVNYYNRVHVLMKHPLSVPLILHYLHTL